MQWLLGGTGGQWEGAVWELVLVGWSGGARWVGRWGGREGLPVFSSNVLGVLGLLMMKIRSLSTRLMYTLISGPAKETWGPEMINVTDENKYINLTSTHTVRHGKGIHTHLDRYLSTHTLSPWCSGWHICLNQEVPGLIPGQCSDWWSVSLNLCILSTQQLLV